MPNFAASRNPRQAHDSWRRLRTFLERHDAPKHQYARTVLDTVLSYDRRFAVPSWLYALFKGHIEDLLRVLMRHGLLDKAARVAVEALQNVGARECVN